MRDSGFGVEERLATVDQAVGGNLRRLRLERQLSQEALAQSIHIGTAELIGFEAGHARLASLTLCLLARTMDVPVSAFFDNTGRVARHPVLERNSFTVS